MRCDKCGADTFAWWDSNEKVWKIECKYCKNVMYKSKSVMEVVKRIRGEK